MNQCSFTSSPSATSCLVSSISASTPSSLSVLELCSISTTSKTAHFLSNPKSRCETGLLGAFSALQELHRSKCREHLPSAPVADERHCNTDLEPRSSHSAQFPPQCDRSKKRARHRRQIKRAQELKCHRHTTTFSRTHSQKGRLRCHPLHLI